MCFKNFALCKNNHSLAFRHPQSENTRYRSVLSIVRSPRVLGYAEVRVARSERTRVITNARSISRFLRLLSLSTVSSTSPAAEDISRDAREIDSQYSMMTGRTKGPSSHATIYSQSSIYRIAKFLLEFLDYIYIFRIFI